MTDSELKNLKRKVKKLIDSTDERVLRMLHGIMKADEEWQTAANKKTISKK